MIVNIFCVLFITRFETNWAVTPLEETNVCRYIYYLPLMSIVMAECMSCGCNYSKCALWSGVVMMIQAIAMTLAMMMV